LRRRFFIGRRPARRAIAVAPFDADISVNAMELTMKIDLSGKTALVTGSTAGIGHAIARGLAGAGADVTVNGRTAAKTDAAAEVIARAMFLSDS
jgi:ApbE superfamily uncharacterized protein (UPF0280 family)